MELSTPTKIGLALAAGAGAAALAALLGRRRRHTYASSTSPTELGGTWSDSVEKLASKTGEIPKDKGVILSWALPPGPPPGPQSTVREDLRTVCRKAGGKQGLYKLRQEPWEEQAARLHLPASTIARFGKAGREKLAKIFPSHKVNAEIQKQRVAAVAKHLGISETEARKRMPTGLDRLHAKVGEWWHAGTCPGCSEQCSRSCYVAKTAASYFGSQRQMWGNVCDVVEGRGLPRILEDDCEGVTGSSRKDRPCTAKLGVKLIASPGSDAASRDAVVDAKRLDAVYIRVHVAGDMFDKAYAEAWLKHARDSVTRYKREYERWQRGERRTPPVRTYYWAYTRSWRVGMRKDHNRPDPALLDVIRTLPTIEYPEERWPAWAAEEAAKDTCGGQPCAPGGLRRKSKQAFAVLLSADSSTGIPWVKDKADQIMPVSFVLTEADLTTLDEAGRPVVLDWDKKVPGIVLRDHSLRKVPKSVGGAWESGKGQFWCPMEDPGVGAERKEQISGCYNCRLCMPGVVENAAEVMFKRYMRGWPDGESFAQMEAAKRGAPLDWYDNWKKHGPVFQLAVPPVATTFKRVSASNKGRIKHWMKWKLNRLPLVGE